MDYRSEINRIGAEMIELSKSVHNDLRRQPKGRLAISVENGYTKYRQEWFDDSGRHISIS